MNSQRMIATAEGSIVEINGEKVPATFDRTDVIVNGEAVHVSETVGGGAAPAVLGSESFNVNGESVSVIFDGTTSLMNGEVVTASEEGSTVTIGSNFASQH